MSGKKLSLIMNFPETVLIWWISMLLASSPVAVVTSGSALTTGSNVTLDDLYMLLASINGLLVRINEYFDYIVAFAVVILLCVLYYRYIEYFTRF